MAEEEIKNKEKLAATKSGEPRPDDSGREECEKKAAEYLAGWQRERADFLNHKKEEIERVSELLKYAGEEIVSRILPILDNFEIAERNLKEDLKNDANVKGILQIKNQLQNFLKTCGVEEIKAEGEKFDPNFMEAVEKSEEEQKGYIINGRLLRPAKVKIIK